MSEIERLKEELSLLKREIALAEDPIRLETLQKNLILSYEYYVFLLDTSKRAAA